MSRKGIIAKSNKAVFAWGKRHMGVVYALIVVAIVAMGALLLWFLAFSGYDKPVQFIYAGF